MLKYAIIPEDDKSYNWMRWTEGKKKEGFQALAEFMFFRG